MRILLAALATGFIWLAAACSPGQVSPSQFRQPLPEPPVNQAANAADPSRLLSGLLSSIQTAQFRIVGTEMAPGPQGQIRSTVYHVDGALTIKTPALELQPWNDPMTAGPEADIDGRGDFVMDGSDILLRPNTFNAWQTTNQT